MPLGYYALGQRILIGQGDIGLLGKARCVPLLRESTWMSPDQEEETGVHKQHSKTLETLQGVGRQPLVWQTKKEEQ